MAIQFGTSGLRGLAVEFTEDVVQAYTCSFLSYAAGKSSFKKVIVAGDFREHTPKIKSYVTKAILQMGFEVEDGGVAPTPALAYACLEQRSPGIMITGSHIPADRNGIKFYLPTGEILKEDEKAITKGLEGQATSTAVLGKTKSFDLNQFFIDRYLQFLPDQALTGMSLLFYEHSTTAKKVLPQLLTQLGAKVRSVFPSEIFIPVDTEALAEHPELERMASSGEYFATLSADGDGDRPLLIDEQGQVVRGDQIGMIVSQYLHADMVVTPISSNSGISDLGFKTVTFTKIGSPYVIEGMNTAKSGRVVGYEANGGFLLGSDAGKLKALPTRDSVLAVLGCLLAARQQKKKLSELVQGLPQKYTWSELIKGIDTKKAQQILEGLRAKSEFFGKGVERVDSLDGLRFYLKNKEVLHFRPSGNAPEFRIYTEAASVEAARGLADQAKKWLQA